jgi:hypothetical protein
MKENIVQDYYQKLIQSETPHLILASFYTALFDKELQNSEWGMLRRLIKLYGREVVFDALVRTASSTTVDTSKSLWPYVNSVAIGLTDTANKVTKQSIETNKTIDRTIILIQELKQINSALVELISEENFYSGSIAE